MICNAGHLTESVTAHGVVKKSNPIHFVQHKADRKVKYGSQGPRIYGPLNDAIYPSFTSMRFNCLVMSILQILLSEHG